jgi:hypothetical protein
MSQRQFRRYRHRHESDGDERLRDRRLGKVSGKAVPVDEVQRVLALYKTTYAGWNVKLFHEHGVRDHRFTWGYTWTKNALQVAGLVRRAKSKANRFAWRDS